MKTLKETEKFSGTPEEETSENKVQQSPPLKGNDDLFATPSAEKRARLRQAENELRLEQLKITRQLRKLLKELDEALLSHEPIKKTLAEIEELIIQLKLPPSHTSPPEPPSRAQAKRQLHQFFEGDFQDNYLTDPDEQAPCLQEDARCIEALRTLILHKEFADESTPMNHPKGLLKSIHTHPDFNFPHPGVPFQSRWARIMALTLLKLMIEKNAGQAKGLGVYFGARSENSVTENTKSIIIDGLGSDLSQPFMSYKVATLKVSLDRNTPWALKLVSAVRKVTILDPEHWDYTKKLWALCDLPSLDQKSS